MTVAPCKTLVEYRNQKDIRYYFPKRYIVMLLGFWGIFNVFLLRVNLSVAMLAMVNTTSDVIKNDSHYYTECQELKISNNTDNKLKIYKGEKFNWDARTQGYVMSSFFYCYFITVSTGGYLADRFGSKHLLGGGIMVTAILTLLTPVTVHWGLVPFLLLRALEGLAEGLSYPSINSMIGRWSPKNERSRISTFIFVGGPVGSIFTYPVAGWLCGTDFFGGWPSVFYVFGIIACIWFVFWAIFIYDSPHEHPNISKEELSLYYDANVGALIKEEHKVLWTKIFTSIPAWALLITHAGTVFVYVFMITEIPNYLRQILHFSIENSGLITGIPYLCECIGAYMAAIMADKLISSKRLSRTVVRKISNSIALFGTAASFIGITISGCRPIPVIVLYCFCLWSYSFKYSGFNVTHMEMCPQLAGTLYGIANGIGNMISMTGPIMVGAILQSGDTLENWNTVFYIIAAVQLCAGIVYAVFASAEQQNWIEEKSMDNCHSSKDMGKQRF